MNQINWKRWLPTSAPLISGAIASAVVLGLRKLGIVVLPQEVTAAITPAFAFLVAAVVHKPSAGQVKTLAGAEEATLGSILAREFQGRLDSDPDLIQRVLNTVLPVTPEPKTVRRPGVYIDGREMYPPPSNTAAANPDQPRSNLGAVYVPPLPSLPSEPRKVAIVSPSSAAVIPVAGTATNVSPQEGTHPGPPADAVDEHGNLTQP